MISAKMVKELREATGAGMLDCKKALEASNGVIEEAIVWLREKGIAKAAKKASRIAAEGLAICQTDQNTAVIVEVNSETDFVAKNDEFKKLVTNIATALLRSSAKTIEEANKLEIDGKTIEKMIIEKTATLGEKISLRRFAIITKEDNQVFGVYSHMGGKIVSLCVLTKDTDLSKDMAMQVAAMRPRYLNRQMVPEKEINEERNILKEQAENEGIEKKKVDMVIMGRLNKFYEEVCLLDQVFIKENKMKVGQYLKTKGSEIISFIRYEVGEGIEKNEVNFAEEVMKQINN